MKALVTGHTRYGRKGGANKFVFGNALVCEFHFNRNDINISLGKSKKSLKRFRQIKGRPLQLGERLRHLKRDGIPGDRFYAGSK